MKSENKESNCDQKVHVQKYKTKTASRSKHVQGEPEVTHQKDIVNQQIRGK